MGPLRLPQPGDRYVSAEVFRALVAELIRAGKIEGTGLAIDSGAGGTTISAPPRPPAFWAKLTGEPSSGRYSWEEVERTGIDTFTKLEYGRDDDGMKEPAVEANKVRGIPRDTYVWLELGFGRPHSSGVEQEWLFRHGGGGDREIDVEITGFVCSQGSYSFREIEHAGGNNWTPKQGGVTTSFCYHIEGGNYPGGGPLLEVGTRCRAKPGKLVGSDQHWVIDCPAGWKGQDRYAHNVRCENNNIVADYRWLQARNGQLIREPCAVPQPGVCNPCQTAPFSPFGSFGQLAMLAAGLASAWGAFL